MNATTILKKGEGILLLVYRGFTDKFKNISRKLKGVFPVLDRYPLLIYSLIPLLVALFLLLRYIIKFVINELAAWASGFLGETSGITISDRAIVLSIAAMFIILRVAVLFNKQKKKKANEMELNHDGTK